MKGLQTVALFVALIVVTAIHGDDTSTVAKMLVGEWVVQSAERDQQPAKELVGATYEFKDGKMTATPTDEKLPPRSATYRVLAPEAADRPARIAFTPQDGPNKGKELEGVIRFKGDALLFCHCGVPRAEKGFPPTDFVTKKGSGWVLLTLKPKEKK
jgi:uncharacterized protein (TIGR03067 family)